MRTRLFYLGYSKGWAMATRYAAGTRAERRAIRGRLARLAESYSQFATGVWEGFNDLAEQRSAAILAGLAPRTVNPHKLARVLARTG